MKKTGFVFRFYDFTKEEESFFKRSSELLEDLKSSFAKEGLEKLYTIKKKRSVKKGYFGTKKNLSRRTFTIIEKVRFLSKNSGS